MENLLIETEASHVLSVDALFGQADAVSGCTRGVVQHNASTLYSVARLVQYCLEYRHLGWSMLINK
jgi:hypothetical protein